MNKKLSILLITSTFTLSLAACTEEQRMSYKSPGSHESTETVTDANGMKTVRNSTTEVSVDEYGNKKEVITSKVSRDPKGLMNKTTVKSKQVIENK